MCGAPHWPPCRFESARSPDCQLFLDSPSVSQTHAELALHQGELHLTDLSSTNGTFLNDERLEGSRSVGDGDVVRFADWEFRAVKRNDALVVPTATEELRSFSRTPSGELEVARMFREVLRSRSLWAVFQPIVRLSDRTVVGYEALGRATMNGAEVLPGELFTIAEGLGRAAELSHLLRREQLRDGAMLPEDSEIFLNTHPAELRSASTLVDSLETAGKRNGSRPRVCIEIHETAAMDLKLLAGLREKLATMGVNVAFDDFGTGQPRLFELAEISPMYLKFDRAWIHDLDNASERRLELVRTLIRMGARIQDHADRRRRGTTRGSPSMRRAWLRACAGLLPGPSRAGRGFLSNGAYPIRHSSRPSRGPPHRRRPMPVAHLSARAGRQVERPHPLAPERGRRCASASCGAWWRALPKRCWPNNCGSSRPTGSSTVRTSRRCRRGSSTP